MNYTYSLKEGESTRVTSALHLDKNNKPIYGVGKEN